MQQARALLAWALSSAAIIAAIGVYLMH